MITLYPLKYNEYYNYYKSLNFTLNETDLILNITGTFANQNKNLNIQLNKHTIAASETVLNNSLTVLYTYLVVDLYSYTYDFGNVSFNSTKPSKPEFILYLNNNYECINNYISLFVSSSILGINMLNPYSSTINYSLTSKYSLTSNYSLTALTLNGYTISVTSSPNSIVLSDSNGKIDMSWLPNASRITVLSYSKFTPSANTIYQESRDTLLFIVTADIYGIFISPDTNIWHGPFGSDLDVSYEYLTLTLFIPKNWYWKFTSTTASSNSTPTPSWYKMQIQIL
jgi:hypothetical protein